MNLFARTPGRRLRTLAPVGIVLFFGASCSQRSGPEFAPTPPECTQFASMVGACFRSPDAEKATRDGFPAIQKDDVGALETLRANCSRNLSQLRSDCR